ncbi:MAG: GGDEF domain-containing protein [Geminicoccaceae bacterium]|nr:GGDEF domain-containing protein [Geminicoccaceae bacterium]
MLDVVLRQPCDLLAACLPLQALLAGLGRAFRRLAGILAGRGAVFNGLPMATVLLDGRGRIRAANAAWGERWRSASWDRSLRGMGIGGPDVEALCDGTDQVLEGRARQFTADAACFAGDAARWFRFTAVRLQGVRARLDGARMMVTRLDVTDLYLARQEAHEAARRDPLTGLGNRTVLDERLADLEAADPAAAPPCAVLLIDLDGFKEVNDGHGHAAGDLLLRVVASRLRDVVGAGGTVLRIGGDEFVVLMDCMDIGPTSRVAMEVLAAIMRPLRVGGATVRIGASIGVGVWPRHGRRVERLLAAADAALYAAKRAGKSHYRLAA